MRSTIVSVIVKSSVVSSSLIGTIAMPVGSGFNMTVDFAVSQLRLPEAVCDSLADSLGRVFDHDTELYTVNVSTHKKFRQEMPQFNFTLTANGSADDATNIQLSYSAFDLQASLPLYESSTPYFPIRRAANESQYVLGRTFLQEAYIVVDWERGNFTVGQVV